MKTDPSTSSVGAVLDELEAAARNAPNPDEPWIYTGDVSSLPLDIAASPYDGEDRNPDLWERVARHIAAFDPPTALALIEVARAAWTINESPAGQRYGLLPLDNAFDSLRAALGRLTEGRAE